MAYHGGGISVKESDLTVTNSTICDNYADASAYGGGINCETSGTVIVTNCTISNNTSTNAGGGIAIANVTLVIKNTILANNTGNSSSNDFYRYSGSVTDNGYNMFWDARNNAGAVMNSGVYFIMFRAGNFVKTQKVLLMR